MARMLIEGGTVVTATEIMEADVLIDGGKVVALYARGVDGLAAALARAALEVSAETVIDATGKYVMPGGV
ncbi:MAG: dihydropyrimidinase, partial [Acidimicrobiia bacterium]